MSDFTFLEKEQVFGEHQLSVLKKYGVKAIQTDFSILLGGYNAIDNNHYGFYWLKNLINDEVVVVNYSGSLKHDADNIKNVASRPVLPMNDDIKNLIDKKGNLLFCRRSKQPNVLREVEYGFYPQMAVSDDMQKKLEKEYSISNLEYSGNSFTVDKNDWLTKDCDFSPLVIPEYIYEGKHYVRVINRSCCDFATLNDGRKVKRDDFVWLEVSPVKWLVDKETNLLVSEYLLFSNISYSYNKNDKNNFEATGIKWYLDNIFAKELTQMLQFNQPKHSETEESEKLQKEPNPYHLDFSKVSEEDIIKGVILSNVAVFLHGRSSDGKSSRVKQLDHDCTILYLRNATPDSLNGKSVYNENTGEMLDIPPTWYKKVVEKCEKEPDKIHIVFFDELTNALPSIQGMAFNIILDGEVNGIWKLPKNARIVAAGNDLDDSLAANEMAEPLFNRFAHVYINTTTNDWLKWAATESKNYTSLSYEPKENPMKIHPAIYAFIYYEKLYEHNILRTRFDGKKPNADPRKWEMASKVLYQTGKPEMLRALIGEVLTKKFIAFCNQKAISYNDIITKKWDIEAVADAHIGTSERYATTVSLAMQTKEEDLEIVRDFISWFGKGLLSMFDAIWTYNNPKRLETLNNLKLVKAKKAKQYLEAVNFFNQLDYMDNNQTPNL